MSNKNTGSTYITSVVAVTANTNTSVTPAKARRQSFFIQNVGTTDVYISTNPMTAAGQGWILAAGSAREWDSSIPLNAFYAWCISTSTLIVEEA